MHHSIFVQYNGAGCMNGLPIVPYGV